MVFKILDTGEHKHKQTFCTCCYDVTDHKLFSDKFVCLGCGHKTDLVPFYQQDQLSIKYQYLVTR